jgi:hypothetical protein
VLSGESALTEALTLCRRNAKIPKPKTLLCRDRSGSAIERAPCQQTTRKAPVSWRDDNLFRKLTTRATLPRAPITVQRLRASSDSKDNLRVFMKRGLSDRALIGFEEGLAEAFSAY